jgi:1-deoxy-D-xylulose-5-phosphate synthase
MMHTALELDGPSAIRFARGAARQVDPSDVGHGLEARQLRAGTDVCLLAVGRMVEPALQAADLLAAGGVRATVWDVRVVKPLDDNMLADAAAHQLVVTIEDGVRVGAAGSAIQDALAARNAGAHAPPTLMLGVPVTYVPHSQDPARLLCRFGLDAEGIAASVKRALAPVT